MAGQVDDTGDLLRGVRASARESYFRKSASRRYYLAFVVAILLVVCVIGITAGGFSGHVVAIGGAFGLALVSVWLYLH